VIAARPFGISRRLLLVFLGVVLFCVAQIAWWITFQIHHSGDDLRYRAERLEGDRRVAVELIRARAAAGQDEPGLPGRILQSEFPDLVWNEEAEASPGLAPYFPRGEVQIRPELLEDLRERRTRRLRMFVSEGTFFLLVVSLGVLIIFHALRREVSLKRQQSNFVSAVTHELKSPLAAIRLFAETLELRDLGPEKRSQYLRAIQKDVDRLEMLVVNLLTVARLESGQVQLHPQPTDLVREVVENLEGLREALAERGVRLELEAGAEEIPVRSDGLALQTVLRNLVDNAAKYGGEGTTVHVRVRREAGRALLEVRDEGIGFPSSEKERIFQKFYRVGDEMVRRVEGSGLGLYLVRALVRRGGGEVSAESEGAGRGATFRVSYPIGGGGPA
jgi:signal transduction histidine kinase